MKVLKFPFAYNTPGLLTGAPLYVPTPGELLIVTWLDVIRPWNGTTPTGSAGSYLGAGDVIMSGQDMTTAQAGTDLRGMTYGAAAAARFVTSSPLCVLVDDGAGGATGATHGVAALGLLVLNAYEAAGFREVVG